MGLQTPITTSFDLPDGRTVTIETGKLATQADGSVVIRVGDTMLFCSVVSAKEAREGQPFFPLSVDYQEKYASAGRIPGNFFRREAKLSDYEVLISRLVDRAIRPLFPDGYMNDTQVIINLISGEQEVLPDAFAALAASSALAVSDIPFAGPISEVRVARINGRYIVNPFRSDLENADLDIIVAATMDNVMMVEGEANEVPESALIEAIKIGHEAIKVQCQAQLDLAEKVGEKATVKREFVPPVVEDEVKEIVESNTRDKIHEVAAGALDKVARKEGFKAIIEELMEKLKEEKSEEFMEEYGDEIKGYYDKFKKEVIREMVLTDSRRLDGRKFDEIRDIWCEVDYLPSAHGSAVFTRGETQSLTSLTLGTKQDELMVDTAMDHSFSNFILHYNFPAFSVGEIKPMRGPGRREVGHANLAARSLKKVMPEEMPYTIRIVSDILESNGSSSMATVCAGALALMDGGIQIKAPVSGIAMGMISDGKRTAILSDILGDEDALGDMDFKVTGTENGITACQMDIKIDGLPYEELEKALNQAREGRLHILNEMKKALEAPREDLKPHAPRIVEIIIDKSFIGAVIGPGGKVIQEIQAETGTNINIEEVGDEGVVSIASENKESIDAALARIRRITFTPSVGDTYDAVVKTVMPYGVFVDFMGKSGLLHVSEIDHARVERVEDFFQEGDEVRVKLIGVDKKTGKLRLSRKALLPRPEGGGDRDNGRDDNRGGGNRRNRD
ncbi:polyribonucleotide nucleotidyltransferase [Phaeodactylibacter sp.]|jgi:polyribonucleotide nucleotidyltransferase|uniref:polyribonucleotide nucleotidyltransferase n=1 Tax=Phaeodactylibacter sp. TaxID=1940289 RepID=UPI0025CF61C9|nr:polyribonucleotide nucleotidyltransferase [Phaeodactylibacter sp.]MCI4651137.1 polyribonucleotide nucleotidyltransferase [Phaeodactylibacter sp.]MCI5089522.1 polyribonucleotide nucleotidyltransferase [Phaeodactylibacter sp.]